MSSTRLDRGRSAGVSAGAHAEGERPKVRGPPLARFRRGFEVPTARRSEDPAAPAPSRAPSPSRKKNPVAFVPVLPPNAAMLPDNTMSKEGITVEEIMEWRVNPREFCQCHRKQFDEHRDQLGRRSCPNYDMKAPAGIGTPINKEVIRGKLACLGRSGAATSKQFLAAKIRRKKEPQSTPGPQAASERFRGRRG